MNAACVAFIHPSLNLHRHNLMKDRFPTVPSSHSKQEEEWKETCQRTSPQFVQKDRRGNSSTLCRKRNCRMVLQFRAVGCCPGELLPSLCSSYAQLCHKKLQGHFRLQRVLTWKYSDLQLQAANTSALSPWMTQGTWALNTGLNRTPAIWGWCTKVWT